MKVNGKFSLFILIILIIATNIYAFERDSTGNWSGEINVSIYCDITKIDYDMDKLAKFTAKMEASEIVADVFSKKWNINREDVKPFLFTLIDSDIEKISGNYQQNRIDFRISLYLDKYIIENAAMLFRFDVEKRLLYILPWNRMTDLYLNTIKYQKYADVFMSAEEAEDSCSLAGNIFRYSDLCAYMTDDPFGMMGLASLTNILMGYEFPEFYFFDGVLNLAEGKFADADEDFEYFLDYYPENVPALLYKAVLSEQLGTGLSGEYLQMADDYNPEDEISLILAANVNRLFWLHDTAKNYYKKAAQKYPSNYLPHMFIGEYEYNAGNFQEALKLFQKAYDVGGFESFHAEVLKEAIDNTKSQF